MFSTHICIILFSIIFSINQGRSCEVLEFAVEEISKD
jgi:hypothetical protein